MNVQAMGRDAAIYEKFLRRISIDESGCWIYAGCRSGAGYTQIRHLGYREIGHRYSYMIFKGPIPKGLTIDHLCRVRNCVNPEHLEAVTIGENVRRGTGIQALKAHQMSLSPEQRKQRAKMASDRAAEMLTSRPTCVRGHVYPNKPKRHSTRGHRICGLCEKDDRKRRWQREKSRQEIRNAS